MQHSLASATLAWRHDPLSNRPASRTIPPAVKLYVCAMVAVGTLSIAYSLVEAGALRAAPYWVGLAILTLFAGPFSIRVTSARATVSASETFVLALAILFGPAPATLTVVLDALLGSLWNRNDSHYRTWFSIAERTIAVWLSAQLYYSLSDAAPLFLEPVELGHVALPLLAMTTSYFLLSGWFAGTAVWVDHYVSPFQILKERWTQLALNFVLSLGLLALLVLNAGDVAPAAGGLLVTLLVVAYVSSKLTARRLERRTIVEGDRTFQELAENSDDVLWIMDARGFKFTYVSPAYERVWGRDRRDVHDPAKGWTGAIHAEDRERVLAVLGPESVTCGFKIEYRVVHTDGTVRWIKDRGFPISDPGGVVRRIVGMAEDVTDRRKLEQQLVGSQKMEGMGRLAGGVAHDFNNLLTAILGYSESIVRQSDPGDPLHEDALEIQRAGEKAAALTRQLLAFSRRQALKMTVVDLNAVVEDLNQMLGRLIGEHIVIETRLAPDLEPITADRSQLEQILINLAVNAQDAMSEGGRLTIATSTVDLDETDTGQFLIPAGRYTILTVKDTGTGMDSQTQAQIFEPFFTTKDPGEGSGLGLATVYGTVKQLGGFIEVTSAPGRGTTFTISLPATDRPITRVARTETTSAEPGRGETILLVEDDAAVRAYAAQVLRRASYDVLEAPTPEAALRVADEDAPIHGVLTDVIMPGMNGKQMVTRLLKTRPELKVLYMSGYSGTTYFDPSIIDRARECLLDKPFTANTLLHTLREVLDGPSRATPLEDERPR